MNTATVPAETIGDRIRKVREARGLTQSQLARLTKNMTSQAINLIESGQTKSPTPENLFYIADALETDARELVFGLRDTTLSTSQTMARLLDMLPDSERQKSLDFSYFTVEKSAALIAAEMRPSYTAMMDKVRKDMDIKKPNEP